MSSCCAILFFFVNDTATTEIYTLSLHDALPILPDDHVAAADVPQHGDAHLAREGAAGFRDRKSTRLNSSHMGISYAVFCLKKKNMKVLGVIGARHAGAREHVERCVVSV